MDQHPYRFLGRLVATLWRCPRLVGCSLLPLGIPRVSCRLRVSERSQLVPSHRMLSALLAVVLVLSSLSLVPLAKREVPTAAAASSTQIGVTTPFLGTVSRQAPTGDIRRIDTQMQIIRSYGVRIASVWAWFDSNYLRADDIDMLYQNGVRTFVVRVGSRAPCSSVDPLTFSHITGRLTLARPYNSTTASLVQRLNAYLSSDSSVRVYIQLGNEADNEYDANCDGRTQDVLADLRAYSNTLADLAPQMRNWINQTFGNNASRVTLAAGTIANSIQLDYNTLKSRIDAVFSNPGVLSGYDAFSINMYAYERFYAGSLSNPLDVVLSMRYLKSLVGSKTVYVGEVGISGVQNLVGWGLPNVIGEGTNGTRQPGVVKGYSIREMLLDPNNQVAFGLLYTLGCWYESSPDLVTRSQCDNLTTPVKPFQASASDTDLVADYRRGFSRNQYILDRALLDTVFARIPESGVSFNPACVYSGTGCTTWNYYHDGLESVGGSIYIYGTRLGWWFNPSTNRWFLVTERGILSESQSSNHELGFLRAIRAGYLCAPGSTSSLCKDTGRTIGRFRLILRCESGTGPGNCYIRNVNGVLKRNPFDYAAVVRDSTACPHYDSVTGFQVCGHFWTDHVSRMGRQSGTTGITDQERIALLGRPISTHFHETVTIGSDVCHYLVQYFERGVLRYEHPNGLASGSSSNCPRTTSEPWDAPLIRLGAGVPRTYSAESDFNPHINGTILGVLEVYRMR
jgi:hypothetical protein